MSDTDPARKGYDVDKELTRFHKIGLTAWDLPELVEALEKERDQLRRELEDARKVCGVERTAREKAEAERDAAVAALAEVKGDVESLYNEALKLPVQESRGRFLCRASSAIRVIEKYFASLDAGEGG